MLSLKKKLFEYLESNILEMAILNGFDSITNKKTWHKLLLEFFINFYFYFGAVWMLFTYEFEDSKAKYIIKGFVLAMMILAVFLEILKSILIYRSHSKTQLSRKNRAKLALIKLFNLWAHHILFALIVIYLSEEQKFDCISRIETIFALFVRYIISTVSICQGILKWESLCFQYLLTTVIIQGKFILGSQIYYNERKASSMLNSEMLMGFKYLFMILNIILLTYMMRISKQQAISTNLIKKIVKEGEAGIVILRKRDICYKNGAMGKIFSKNSLKEVEYQDLANLTLNRYVNFPESLHASILKQDPHRKQPSHVMRKSLTFEESLEILKRAPKYPLTFYTNINIKTNNAKSEFSDQSPRSLDISHTVNRGKEFTQVNTDAVKEINDESYTLEYRQFEIKISFVDWDNYGDNYVFVRFSDFTEVQMIVESENQKEFNTHILNSFSHELRTPLNISKNMLEMIMQEESVPNEVKVKFVSVGLASLDVLTNLIYDILDFLKIETEQFEFDLSRFSLAQILEDVLVLTRHRCEEKGITVTSNHLQFPYLKINSDKSRLKRALLNIITYIAKMNNNNSLNLVLQKLDNEFCQLKICKTVSKKYIRESSRTFIPEPHPIIKDLNYNHENDFGLLISKMILDRLTSFGVENFNYNEEVEEGVFFDIQLKLLPEFKLERDISLSGRFTIPFEFDEIENQAHKLPQSPNYWRSKIVNKLIRDFSSELFSCPKALIVDDDVFNLFSLEMILEKMEIQVIKANNGKEAISVLQEYIKAHKCPHPKSCKGIEFILMDLLMPVMNGIESSKILFKLMQDGEIPKIPIIACSANDAKDIVSTCQQIGISDFISKPINPSILKSKIRCSLGYHD